MLKLYFMYGSGEFCVNGEYRILYYTDKKKYYNFTIIIVTYPDKHSRPFGEHFAYTEIVRRIMSRYDECQT